MPKIIDNIVHTAEAELLASLGEAHQLDVAVGYFNLRGWRLIAEAVDAMPRRGEGPKARILVGMAENPSDEMLREADGRTLPRMDNNRKAKLRDDTVGEFRHQLEVGVPTDSDERSLRALERQISDGDVEVRFHASRRLHAKLYLCHRDSSIAPRVGYVGSSNLTKAGLTEQGELSVDVLDVDGTEKLHAWFEDRWDDSHPVDLDLAEAIRNSWAAETQIGPYLVYLKMAYHLSEEARKGLVAYGLPASLEGDLLDFQAAAVKIAARIVMNKGGAMIGDVVGLGKTLVGTATARLLQDEQGYETLVVCPKNLVGMWEEYLHRYEVRGRVESLSMVHKTLTGDERLGRHRLVIVDEAHNLRSPKRRDYQAVREYIKDNESKALLLTATPYNKEFSDLAAQLGLFIPDDRDLGLRPQRAIDEKGEYEFDRLCGDSTVTSLPAFKKSEHIEDWQALMSLYLIRRTRRFVEENYAVEDADGRRYLEFGNGEKFFFPKRTAVPISSAVSEDDPAALMMDDTTLDIIGSLLLPRYNLGNYLDESFAPPTAADEKLADDLRAAMGGTLSGFTRVTMFKRLSSSGPAFLATLRRHRLRNLVSLHALKHGKRYPVGSADKKMWAAETDIDEEDSGEDSSDLRHLWGTGEDAETAERAYNLLEKKNPKAIRWTSCEMFDSNLAEDLESDCEAIGKLLDRFGTWDATRDKKIASLVDLLISKHPDDKVLVFTEAADTALYIHGELERRGVPGVGVVTGDSDNPASLTKRFSPRSNNAVTGDGEVGDELRVLVSTDVLSEGQNLQDSHIVVNYDLPWAIVRLVQRAGRVDRIGQQSSGVLIYSLLPADSVEQQIKLRKRIKQRLGESANLLGSDEEYFGDDTEKRFIEGVYDEKADQPGESTDSVDAVSMAYEIWRRAEAEHPDIAETVKGLPNIVYSTKQAARQSTGSGVLVHTRRVTGSDEFALVDGSSGNVRSVTPQTALRVAECSPDTPILSRLEDHHELTRLGREASGEWGKGKPSSSLGGVREKVWKRLEISGGKSRLQGNIFFTVKELDVALTEMNERYLLDDAKHRLSKALSGRDDDLAALVVHLHKDGLLCQPPPENSGEPPLAIICTMGLKQA